MPDETTADEARTGLVPLDVLANYRLVNLVDAEALAELAAGSPLALAAFCDRPHGFLGGDAGPYLLTVAATGGVTDNLAELAWAAVDHEADLHGGADLPYRRWEVGADLDRLYANTRTLFAGVEQLACALNIDWTTQDPAAVFRATAFRLGQYAGVVAACRAGLAETPPTPDWHRAMDALNGLAGLLTPAPPVEAPRCTVVATREQADTIAKRAGVPRVDADWRCYLAPHSGGWHKVLPDQRGSTFPFAGPEEPRRGEVARF